MFCYEKGINLLAKENYHDLAYNRLFYMADKEALLSAF